MLPPREIRDYFKGDRERALEQLRGFSPRGRKALAAGIAFIQLATIGGIAAGAWTHLDAAAWIAIAVAGALCLVTAWLMAFRWEAFIRWQYRGVPPADSPSQRNDDSLPGSEDA